MSNVVLSLYHRKIRPLNDIETTDAMLRILVEIPAEQQQRFWINNTDGVGQVCVFAHEKFPGKFLEYVQGSKADSVTSLYEADDLFANLERLKAVRQDLITEIGRVLMALPSTVVAYDSGREREVFLSEVGTAGLIDMLAHFTHTDLATV